MEGRIVMLVTSTRPAKQAAVQGCGGHMNHEDNNRRRRRQSRHFDPKYWMVSASHQF
jgi:hypothetical protein